MTPRGPETGSGGAGMGAQLGLAATDPELLRAGRDCRAGMGREDKRLSGSF